MPASKRIPCRNKRAFLNFSRYFGNPRVRSHGQKVRIDAEMPLGPAPLSRFEPWWEQMRRKALKSPRRHRGRPLARGTWYAMTFPDWSGLDRREMRYYELAVTRALDRGAAGKTVWHHKLLFDTHDFNVLVAPFYMIGGQLGPRRDRDHSEFQRIKRASDRALEKINRRRLALGRPLIPTLPEIQARIRVQKKWRTASEALAASRHFKTYLAIEAKKPQTEDQLWEALVRGLRETDFNVVKPSKRKSKWFVHLRRADLPKGRPQRFSLIQLACEAMQLVFAKEQSAPSLTPTKTLPAATRKPKPARAADGPSNPPALNRSEPDAPHIAPFPTKSKTATPDITATSMPTEAPLPSSQAMSALEVIQQLFNRSAHGWTFLHDVDDLVQRLRETGYHVAHHTERRLGIADGHGQVLEVDKYDFVVECQRQVLQRELYGAHFNPGLIAQPPDFAAYNTRQQKAAQWNFPAFGSFWDTAKKTCNDLAASISWQESVKATERERNPKKRIGLLRKKLRQKRVNSFGIFVLLQMHCGASPEISPWLLADDVEATLEFDQCRRHFTPKGYEPSTHTPRQNRARGH